MGRARNRWTMHPDMLYQYAQCLSERLEAEGVKDPEIYFDVWKSMNQRFTQRAWDPRIDIAHYEWDPFKHNTYALPLLSHLGNWRERMKELENEIQSDEIDVTFVADFPGLELENYLSPDLDNTTIELMGGEISIRLDDQERMIISYWREIVI